MAVGVLRSVGLSFILYRHYSLLRTRSARTYCTDETIVGYPCIEMAAKRRKKRSPGPGRPALAPDQIRWNVRLDEATDKALDLLAKKWNCSRSEAMRQALKMMAASKE